MSAKIYTYIGEEPFSKRSNYPYMDKNIDLFAPIKNGDQIAIVKENSVYHVYKLIHKKYEFVFTTDERTKKLLVKKCKEDSYVGVQSDLVDRLKFHLFNIFDFVQKEAVDYFFDPSAKLYNRLLIRNNKKIFTKLQEISSGKEISRLKNEVSIAAEIKPLGEFKILVSELKDKMDSYRTMLQKYIDGLSEYNKVYRYIEASSLDIDSFVSVNDPVIDGITYYGSGIVCTCGNEEFLVIGNDEINIFKKVDSRLKHITKVA